MICAWLTQGAIITRTARHKKVFMPPIANATGITGATGAAGTAATTGATDAAGIADRNVVGRWCGGAIGVGVEVRVEMHAGISLVNTDCLIDSVKARVEMRASVTLGASAGIAAASFVTLFALLGRVINATTAMHR